MLLLIGVLGDHAVFHGYLKDRASVLGYFLLRGLGIVLDRRHKLLDVDRLHIDYLHVSQNGNDVPSQCVSNRLF